MLLYYAQHMGASHPMPELLKMNDSEFRFWFDILDRKLIRDEIQKERIDKNQAMPSVKRMETLIDNKIKKRSKEL